MNELLLVTLLLVASAAGEFCRPPFTQIGEQCIYVETSESMSWAEGNDYCKSLAGDGGVGGLATFPACEDFTFFSRYLELNGFKQELWVGARTLFSPNNWDWVSGETLQTGVPYWDYNEDYSSNENCAASDPSHYHRLIAADCSTAKNFVCSQPLTGQRKRVVPEPRPGPGPEECSHQGIVVGDHCYIFYDHEESWDKAEEKCRDQHEDWGGELFSPSDCNEFAHMAHHLEAAEMNGVYWVGGIDETGEGEWTWVKGGLLPAGPPFWATGEPSHNHENAPREHCAAMNIDMRYYLQDVHCNEHHSYICKLSYFGPDNP